MAGLLEYTKNGQVTEPPLYRFMRGNVQSFLNSIPNPSGLTREEQLNLAANITPTMGLLGTVKIPQLENAAKEYFGITNIPKETGYILDDGTRLDLSGRHYAGGYTKQGNKYVPQSGQMDYLRNDRAVDHRELGNLIPETGGGWEGLGAFIDRTGAVRYDNNSGVSMVNTNKPSPKQLETIVDDFRANKRPLLVDIDRTTDGASLASKEFTRPTLSEVQDWINKQYGLLSNK